MLVQALANESDLEYLAVTPAQLLSKWVGEGERFMQRLFERARTGSVVLFFDECDSFALGRGESGNDHTSRILLEFMVQMNTEIETDSFVIGATNSALASLDGAFVR